MKNKGLLKPCIAVILIVLCLGLFGQEEIILEPKDMTPADTGYYIGGIWKDKNNDGTEEFYNGCLDEYGDANHNEAGVQFGFTYNSCMIMPSCWPKDAADDHALAMIDHAEGYIELTKSRYIDTDSAIMGYIITPPVKNLVSMYLETSPDVSSNPQRHIYFKIEYSKDGGTTWENAFIQDETISKSGDARTYDGSTYLEFEEMKTASVTSPIVIRILSDPQPLAQPQRVKIHYIKIVANKVSAVNEVKTEEPAFRVVDNIIYAEKGSIEVFSILGRLMGSGNSVAVPEGIYIIRTSAGQVSKVFVNY